MATPRTVVPVGCRPGRRRWLEAVLEDAGYAVGLAAVGQGGVADLPGDLAAARPDVVILGTAAEAAVPGQAPGQRVLALAAALTAAPQTRRPPVIVLGQPGLGPADSGGGGGPAPAGAPDGGPTGLDVPLRPNPNIRVMKCKVATAMRARTVQAGC